MTATGRRTHRPAPTFVDGMPGYVVRDWHVTDYACYELAGTGLWFRGPEPQGIEPGGYFTAIGAAQTFGCFTPSPYPSLLAERARLPALNLGYSGAGPRFFLQQPGLLRYVNESRFCIVQVMSARSTSNAVLDNPRGLAFGRRRSDGATISAEDAFEDLHREDMRRTPLGDTRLKRAVLRGTLLPLPQVRRMMQESRRNWLRDYRLLFEAIRVPTILLWFSTRRPAYLPRYHRSAHVLGGFPHLVNGTMMRRLRSFADDYVECVSDRGLPQPLVDRFTGQATSVDLSTDVKSADGHPEEGGNLYSGVWRHNRYYPSPQMHVDAAAMLEPTAGARLGRLGR